MILSKKLKGLITDESCLPWQVTPLINYPKLQTLPLIPSIPLSSLSFPSLFSPLFPLFFPSPSLSSSPLLPSLLPLERILWQPLIIYLPSGCQLWCETPSEFLLQRRQTSLIEIADINSLTRFLQQSASDYSFFPREGKECVVTKLIQRWGKELQCNIIAVIGLVSCCIIYASALDVTRQYQLQGFYYSKCFSNMRWSKNTFFFSDRRIIYIYINRIIF